MAGKYGPERAEAINVLREQIQRARHRLANLAATADAEETAYHLRDEADIEHAALRGEMELMDRIVDMLTDDAGSKNDVQIMEEALDTLRRDIEG
jgi:hypothetical protein